MDDIAEVVQHGYTVSICRSDMDGTVVIQIDSPTDEGGDEPLARVYLNDALIHRGTPFPPDVG